MVLFRLRRRRRRPPQLSTEVLQLIFEGLKPNEPVIGKTTVLFRKPAFGLGWMKVLHVCRKWREACLSHSLLWTDHPDCLIPDLWMKCILNYSAGLPFDLNAKCQTRVLTPSHLPVDLIAEHIGHIRRLTIDEHTASQLFYVRHCEAPILQFLELIPEQDPFTATASMKHFALGVPVEGQRLQSLVIREVMTHLPLPWFIHLVHLEVSFPSWFSSFRWLVTYIEPVLQTLTCIETLILDYALPFADSIRELWNDHVSFPDTLSRLCIQDRCENVVEFSSRVTIPPTATFEIQTHYGDQSLFDVLSALTSRLYPPNTSPLVLSLYYYGSKWENGSPARFSVYLWDTPFYLPGNGEALQKPRMKLASRFVRSFSETLRAIATYLSTHFTQFETLFIGYFSRNLRRNTFHEDAESAMAALLRSASFVRTILAQGRPTAHFVLLALIDNLAADSELERCPDLRQLEFIDLNLSYLVHWRIVKLLRIYLMARKAAADTLNYIPLVVRFKVNDPTKHKNDKWLRSFRKLGFDVEVC